MITLASADGRNASLKASIERIRITVKLTNKAIQESHVMLRASRRMITRQNARGKTLKSIGPEAPQTVANGMATLQAEMTAAVCPNPQPEMV